MPFAARIIHPHRVGVDVPDVLAVESSQGGCWRPLDRLVRDVRCRATQGQPQRGAELSLQLLEVVVELVHTTNSFNLTSARRRSERTVLAGRPNSDAISTRPRSS